MKNNITPNELISELLNSNLSTRRKRSLEIINEVCKEQYQRGSKDFSIPTVGHLSKEKGGPAPRTIRNKDGEVYRSLMNAWANYSSGSTKKPKTVKERTINDDILESIDDPTTRALVGTIIAENRKLKGENQLLKNTSSITIDMRQDTTPTLNSSKDVEVLQPTLNLLPSEVEALKHAISDNLLNTQGWTVDNQGRIKYKNRAIFKPGFINAIKKVLDSIDA